MDHVPGLEVKRLKGPVLQRQLNPDENVDFIKAIQFVWLAYFLADFGRMYSDVWMSVGLLRLRALKQTNERTKTEENSNKNSKQSFKRNSRITKHLHSLSLFCFCVSMGRPSNKVVVPIKLIYQGFL